MARLFDHILNRNLAHVVRFNNRAQLFPESVAEHSYYTAYFALLLSKLSAQKGIAIDSSKAVAMALVHDSEEGFSGDILNPFKHYNNEVEQAIRAVNLEMIKEVFIDLPKTLAVDLEKLWHEEGAQKSLESQVVKVADRLSLLSKCDEEIRGGNSFFQEIYDRELSTLRDLDWDWWVLIKKEVLKGVH